MTQFTLDDKKSLHNKRNVVIPELKSLNFVGSLCDAPGTCFKIVKIC